MPERLVPSFQFNDANYDWTNTNTTSSSQQLLNDALQTLPTDAKNGSIKKGASNAECAKTTFKKQRIETNRKFVRGNNIIGKPPVGRSKGLKRKVFPIWSNRP